MQAGTCGRLDRLHMFIGVFNLLLDICVVAMPLPVLWGLKMSMSKKVALTGIFAMGIVFVLPFQDCSYRILDLI